MLRWSVLVLLLALPITGRADDGRDTSRLGVGLSGAMFINHPGSFGDGGVALTLNTPLWLGQRHRVFQWELGLSALVGYGVERKHAYAVLGPDFGFNLYFGPVYGVELRMGLAGLAQLGARNVAGVGMQGMGAHVFRFWKDDRKRLKVQLNMAFGGYFAPDPGNDMGMGAGAFGLGLVYETPL